MILKKKAAIILFSTLIVCTRVSSQNVSWDAARILLEIEKLNTTGSVLYIAAHPDDENTRLITYLANEKKVRTAYLSLTRGDGGQNLVGEEQGAYLGVIRTQELMEARKTDGGEQFFTSAVDFGYTKTADETFGIWDHERLLEEVVWIVRNFRPEIIITRFPPDSRAGHGQHTVSAIIAQEAFKAAADPNKFPEQLAFVKTWQSQRIFWNTSLRWDNTLADRIKSGSKVALIDVGLYNSLLGASYGEIAAHSRTHHKSQGFGSTPVRGELIEYLELSGGENFDTDIFENINTTWERYRRGSQISLMLSEIIAEFDVQNPALSIPQLLALRAELYSFPDDAEILYKKKQLENILLACAGVWLEPVATADKIATGEKVQIVNNAIVRNRYDVKLVSIEVNKEIIDYNQALKYNMLFTDTLQVTVPHSASSTPYWLQKPYNGFFTVDDKMLIGKPENDPAITFNYNLKFGDQTILVSRGVVNKETDAVKGEIIKPLAIVPALSINFNEDVFVFGKQNNKKIIATVRAGTDLNGALVQLRVPQGWAVDPANVELHLKKDQVDQIEFMIKAPEVESVEKMEVVFKENLQDDWQQAKKITRIEYDHIQRQIIVEDAAPGLVKLNTVIPELRIGYIEGAGDRVFESLEQLGFNITLINPDNFTLSEFQKYDVIVAGVRAYNTLKELADAKNNLLQYIEQGGLYIVQYNTNWDLYTDDFAPFPFKIGRGRVSVETAPVNFIIPHHAVLNTPNKLEISDFDNWVQERGLYFATDLDSAYATPLTFTDPDEQPQYGSLIIADYGKGAFMYTGISFFRELPAGVSGAYRLFINMIAYKQSHK